MSELQPTILDLCGGSGSWSQPYRERGYYVEVLDLMNGDDVRTLKYRDIRVRGILAAPPCTDLAGSGARWWPDKGADALAQALAVADACLRAVVLHKPTWWALENPVGRLRHYYGDPTLIFDPCDYGDPYTKRTLLWGQFSLPDTNPVEPTEGSKMHKLGPSPERQALRSLTPPGFANAFFEANP
jgi:site-specific DNA-cytosine methylase